MTKIYKADESNDTEGHRAAARAVPDDVQGHIRTYPGIVDDPMPRPRPEATEDDTEGHGKC